MLGSNKVERACALNPGPESWTSIFNFVPSTTVDAITIPPGRAACAAFSSEPAQAHKAVTSRYSFSKDVFPLLRDNCGRCHVAGGPAPMSLLTYKDAVAWAEAVRDELTAERMPPWPVDPLGPGVKGAHPINAQDLNVIVTWAWKSMIGGPE